MNYKKKQSRLNKCLLILLLTMSVSHQSIALAKTDECSPVVAACDKALADQQKVIDLKTKTITEQSNVIAIQSKQIFKLENKNSGLFASPWFYLTLGILTGAFAFKGR